MSDIKNASITCTKWLNAAMHFSVMNRRELVLQKNNLVKPILSYSNVKIFYEIQFDSQTNLIVLKNIFECLSKFENLISLRIYVWYSYRERNQQIISTEKCFCENESLSDQSFVQLKSLKNLTIEHEHGGCYLPYFLDVMPELIYLYIDLKKLPYTDDADYLCKGSRNKLFKYLNKGKNRIETFILYSDAEINHFFSTIEGMNLETLCLPSNFTAFSRFTDPNKLLHIVLTGECHSLDSVSNYYPNIETIFVTDSKNLDGIQKLKKLKVFSIVLYINLNLKA